MVASIEHGFEVRCYAGRRIERDEDSQCNQVEVELSNPNETLGLMTSEALRCRFAYENFLRALEADIAKSSSNETLNWLLIQDRFIAWIAHLYEFLKACYAKDLKVRVSNLEDHLKKIHDNKKLDTNGPIDSMIDHYGMVSLENIKDDSLDLKPYFSTGFGEVIRKIRNKQQSHLEPDRINLNWVESFSDKHYYTALSCYKACVLPYAQFNDLPDTTLATLDRFKKLIRSIPESISVTQ